MVMVKAIPIAGAGRIKGVEISAAVLANRLHRYPK